MSQHIEIHVFNTALDASHGAISGLPDTSKLRTCTGCGDALASEERYIPRAVILDGDNEWVRCLYCINSVLALSDRDR